MLAGCAEHCEVAGHRRADASIGSMERPRLAWMAAAGSAFGVLLVLSVGGAARGCRASGQVGELDRRVGRIEVSLGIGDGGAVPSADSPVPGADGGAAPQADDVTPECAVAKIAAYHAWQDALTKAKALAGPAQAAFDPQLFVRTRDAVKAVKDDPKNEVIARARAASDKALATCGDDVE